MIIYGSLVFLGSFLLFLLQPMIAKQILPCVWQEAHSSSLSSGFISMSPGWKGT